MTSFEHTPGPWTIDADDRPGMEWNNHIVQASDPHIRICFMANSGKADNSQCEANAYLIAAAPDLLIEAKNNSAILRALLRKISPVVSFEVSLDIAERIRTTDAAIAKAQGRAS